MQINYWAVLVSAVVSMIVGSIWYGPLFGKQFMKSKGFDKMTPEQSEKMKKSMGLTYFGQFVASLVMFFVLAWYVTTSVHGGAVGGMENAFGLWLGFVVPLAAGEALWGGKKDLFLISISNMLVTLLAAGAIIGSWR